MKNFNVLIYFFSDFIKTDEAKCDKVILFQQLNNEYLFLKGFPFLLTFFSNFTLKKFINKIK